MEVSLLIDAFKYRAMQLSRDVRATVRDLKELANDRDFVMICYSDQSDVFYSIYDLASELTEAAEEVSEMASRPD